MIEDKHIVITAILCLTILECLAILNNIDGVLFSFVVLIVAGLAGFHFRNFTELVGAIAE